MTTPNKNSYDLFDNTEVCKELFDNANDLIQSVDENGRFLYVNKKWRDILGYTDKEARRMAFPDIIHQNHLQACFSLFAELKKSKLFDNIRTQFVAKNGRVIDVDGNISVRMKDGKFVSTWGIFRETVPNSEIEETLRQEQKFSQALIDSLPSIFYVFDQSATRIIFWNKNLEYIFGYSNEETAKMSPLDFIAEKDKEKVQGAIVRAFKEERATIESSILTKDGREIPYFFSAVRMTTASQNYLVGIGIDIGGLKEREQELDRIAKMLVRRDFELFQTNDILRIRDEQIAKEQELNRAKSEFVSLASHQLKTPLTIIKWYIDMLNAGYAGDSPASAKASAGKLEKPFDFTQGKQKEYLGIIYRNTERMIELIDAFLNVSRLELGVFSVKREPINLKDKMELILKNFEPKIKEKNLKLSRIYAKSNFVFAADIKMIQIIFENLVSNAIKYTPHGGEIQIKMSRLRRAPIKSRVLDKVGRSSSATAVGTGQNGGNEILIEVIDTGIGIPADQQSKIFTKFFRADNVSSYEADGSGLGLYIVKTVVEKIGGKIWFKSTERKGAAFYVAFYS